MCDISGSIGEKFIIKCYGCGSINVSVDFYAGFISDCGGDTGSLIITCNECESEFDAKYLT